jgi:endonuclease YncB( thermonuclease family)
MIGSFSISNAFAGRLRGVSLAAMLILAAIAPARAQERGCIAQDAIAATVRSISDGRNLVLTDGREARLAAIEVPPSMTAAAVSALSARTIGRTILLSALTPAADRYGRLNMSAFEAEAGRASLDTALVAQGLALAAVGGTSPCRAALKSAETSARRGRLGLWASDDIKADNAAAILTNRGGFAVVEGKILSVRESGATIYLNFGRRWSEDFTVTILKRNERRLASAGLNPRQLEGRIVRIRGLIEERGGPWVEVVSPDQIELADTR